MSVQSQRQAVEILDDGDRDPLEREAAGRYLERHPRVRLIPRLVAALRDDDEGVRRAAAEALIHLGTRAWPDLLLALMDAKSAGDSRLQRGAYHILHRPLAADITAPLLRELHGIPSSDISAMIEADRLYKRMMSNETFAARVATLHAIKLATPPDATKGKPMDIPLDADVQCVDELAGQSRMVIVDPIRQQVTHFVVEEKDNPYIERLVPLELVQTSTPDLIQLCCTRQELAQQKPFVDAEYLHPILAYMDYQPGAHAMWPYFPAPEPGSTPPEHFHMPPGELSVSRGTRVEASDGQVGQVDEFLVNPQTGQITHLVLREGHLWGQKDVTIPVEQIDHISDGAVFLKLDKLGIEGLPAVHIKRWLI